MRKILSSIAALAFIVSLSTGTSMAKDNPKSQGMGKGDGIGAPSMKCPPGQNPVAGYKTKSGKWIKPYCRKAKHSM
jgi:hypothetical protein